MVARINGEAFNPASQTPQPDPADSHEVVMALEKARAHEAQGALREAARWLRSAADRAERGGHDERVVVFARAAADLMNISGATPPPKAGSSSVPPSTVRECSSVRPPAPKPAAWSSAPPSPRVSSPPPVPTHIPSPRPALPVNPSLRAPASAPPRPVAVPRISSAPAHAQRISSASALAATGADNSASEQTQRVATMRVAIPASSGEASVFVVRRLAAGQPLPAGTTEAMLVLTDRD